jgi:hypothetical protein
MSVGNDGVPHLKQVVRSYTDLIGSRSPVGVDGVIWTGGISSRLLLRNRGSWRRNSSSVLLFCWLVTHLAEKGVGYIGQSLIVGLA